MPLGMGVAVLLIVLGAWLRLPAIIVLGIVVAGAALVHSIWARHGLGGVTYARRLSRTRVAWGEEIPMAIEVWNGKRLPLAWLSAEDMTSDGVYLRDRPLVESDEQRQVLRNTWTLAPFERVVRHVWVSGDRRGLFTIGPTELAAGDLFARQAARSEVDRVDRFLVWPRVVPAPDLARADRWGELERAHAGLLEDPTRFAGVRTYSPGDPLRRLHHRTSARLREPVTKRFEPARERQVLIALDVRPAEGPYWLPADADRLEELCVIGASLTRALADDEATFGLTVAGYTYSRERFADVALGRGPGHAARVLDVLARLSQHASAPFEVLLARIPRRFSAGTTVLAVTLRDPLAFATAFSGLRRSGFSVALLACGPGAAGRARSARAAGFTARAAELDGDWRTATRLAATR
ncbi:MAG TPA: DUF58 domain-containing protein [Candidatus Limnocylindrales bacterium]|nr:DUF58 domain-containing protein [Candidatus Limnocylindrales bacterium]